MVFLCRGQLYVMAEASGLIRVIRLVGGGGAQNQEYYTTGLGLPPPLITLAPGKGDGWSSLNLWYPKQTSWLKPTVETLPPWKIHHWKAWEGLWSESVNALFWGRGGCFCSTSCPGPTAPHHPLEVATLAFSPALCCSVTESHSRSQRPWFSCSGSLQ